MSYRIAVIAPFIKPSGNACRPSLVADVLAEFGEVEIITSDFDHQTMQYSKEQAGVLPYHFHFIPTISYNSKVSINRFVSHIFFGIRVGWYFWRHRSQYDIVYSTLPLNFATWLVLIASKEKVKIIDIIDIWPDTLPFPGFVKCLLSPVFWFWKRIFIASIQNATMLLTVSNSFLTKVQSFKIEKKIMSRMFYIGQTVLPEMRVAKEEIFTISYVGNIGNLYDFATLIDALDSKEFNESIQLFVIGDGDKKEWLLKELCHRGIRHQYFGVVYNLEKLNNILGCTHVGFNGYVNTNASYSYKATAYFAAGIPILNSMGGENGDLHKLIISRGLGMNYEGGNAESLSQVIRECTPEKLKKMSKAAYEFAQNELDPNKIKRCMKEFFSQIL